MSTHPAHLPVMAEHTRRNLFAQAGILAAILFIMSYAPMNADPGTAAVNVVPADGKHRGIVLKSQTVDVVLGEENGHMWADTNVWLRLQNPASKPITVSVSLPGPQLSPARAPLPSPLDVRVNNVPLSLVPASPNDEGEPSEASAAIGLRARTSADVRLSFRQDLPEEQGIIRFTYLLSGADLWAGNPESLRVTVKLDQTIDPRSLLQAAPAVHRSAGQTLTWDWESDWIKSKPSIDLIFMSPGWFAEFDSARAAAEGVDASAAAHLALSHHYQRLASMQTEPLVADPGWHARFYPAAVAELQAAITASTSAAERSQARALLAELYAREAEQTDSGSRTHFLQAAATELELAVQDSPSESSLQESVGEALSQLLQEAVATGDSRAIGVYRQRLEKLKASPVPLETREPTATGQPSATGGEADAGEFDGAGALLSTRDGPAATIGPAAAPPLVTQTTITVTTTSEGRTIELLLGRDENSSMASDLASRTANALRKQSAAQVVAGANKLAIELPGPAGTAMLAMQRALASALPDAPELALLAAVLRDTSGTSGTRSDILSITRTYSERVDLSRALGRWNELAARLEAAQPAPPQAVPAAQSAGTPDIQPFSLESDPMAWRNLAAASSVVYRFESGETDTSREWRLRAGDTQEMSFDTSIWNLYGVRWMAVALVAVVVVVAALIWYLG
jgi:hypothetical protein